MKKIIVLLMSLFILSSCVPSGDRIPDNRTPQEPQIITMDLTVGVTTAEYITNIINVDSVRAYGNISSYRVRLYPCNAIIYMNVTRNGVMSRIVKDLRQIRFSGLIEFEFYNGILSNFSVNGF